MNTRKIDKEIKLQQWMEITRNAEVVDSPLGRGVWNMMSMKKRYYYWLRKV